MGLFSSDSDDSDGIGSSNGRSLEGLTIVAFNMEKGYSPDIPTGSDKVSFDGTNITLEDDGYNISYDNIYSVKPVGRENVDGIEIITGDDVHIAIGYQDRRFPNEILNFVRSKSSLTKTGQNASYNIVGPFDKGNAKLRAEGWTEGASEIDGDIDASSQTKGKSRGLHLGPFSRSKVSSKSSIEGDLSGEITDNTYQAEIKALKLYDDHLTIFMVKGEGLSSESGWLHMGYSDINSLYRMGEDLVIEFGATTFRVTELPNDVLAEEGIEFVKQNSELEEDIDSSQDEDTGNKLRELKELHEEGVLTDDEFEAKKEELLNDF